MKMMFKTFGKKLFGLNYERLTRPLLISLIVFGGLRLSDLRVPVAPSVLYLTVTAYTGGVMWQALSSKDQADYMQNMLMLPFDRRKLVFSCTAALGAYAFLTKTVLLLAVLLAVSEQSFTIIFRSVPSDISCGLLGILTAAALSTLHKRRHIAACLWSAVLATAMIWFGNKPWFLLMVILSCIPALVILLQTDGYALSRQEDTGWHSSEKAIPYSGENTHSLPFTPARTGRICRGNYSVRRYLFRYLAAHKNYLMNTVIMWGIACVLPLFFRQIESPAVIPVGFAILSLNTPICILLSCDPALEQAVRFLPGQERAFCLPYCAFIFLCNLAADSLFLISWQLQAGGITGWMAAAAIFFALLNAACSVLLEWFFPVRNWKIESDLWHHPRKYVVPTAMLLLAGVIGTVFFR